ncbi:MAG: sugar ABC transporter substrate-binding protein [Chloroflexota bacterium]|nr:sugar ABC transporter substrate-binding protein [Chloroflexota bacterium]
MDTRHSRRTILKGAGVSTAALTAFSFAGRPTWVRAQDAGFDYAAAAEPYQGVTIGAPFLDRPGYRAAQAMLPEFQEITGITVNVEIMPYENSREKQVLDFTGGTGFYDIVLVDVVWIGEFAASQWITPLSTFTDNPALADPALNLDGFFPILLESFGTWDKVVYGLPFDNYSGLMYYNRAMLADAGFDAPPNTWQDLKDVYGPALTSGDQVAYALQSRRGETQSADSFMRMVWAFGGSLLNPDTFEPNLSSPESMAGLQFRQDLMAIMPPDVVEWDHDETVQGLAQGRVGVINEWSGFYETLANPETSTIAEDLGIGIEPEGPGGRQPALGGFSLAVNSQSPEEKQAAAWLFIQWVTSEAKATEYIEQGGVSGRTSPYEDSALRERFPFFEPLVESWNEYGNPVFRPRFPEWPQMSEIIAQYGSEMQLGSSSVEDGVRVIEEALMPLLEPYISGERPRLQ